MVDARIGGTRRGERVTLVFDGREIEAHLGETVAMALWAAGVRGLRRSSAQGRPRGVFCAMGICYECLVDVEGSPVRACMQPVVGPRMVVTSRGPTA
ncbi:MAG: (2Fe-2S)-binding protein [Planctomycetota bacterium]